MKPLFLFLVTLICFSCKKQGYIQITNAQDYNSFLHTSNRERYTTALSEKDFWSRRMKPDSSGVGELGPLAAAYNTLFETTGAMEYLKKAESLYKKGIEISANNKDSYVRALARTYIAQHRFKEARVILEESYTGISNKHATEMMLFDVYMELGDYEKADSFLGKIKNNNDYNYLIRLAKWSDHKGDLDSAIKYMEKARATAESSGNKTLKVWTYSNLGDFYGHAGNINNAYQQYLKTLEIEPDNPYAKKGIAWIVYAAEKNTAEANRILDSVMIHHKTPDYYLLKAEMADYDKDPLAATLYTNKFIAAAEASAYGYMYNIHLIEAYAETDPEKALLLAEKEVRNRATPETYHLLAYTQLKSGKKTEALQTIETYVVGKTFEPMAQYHTALVYIANGMDKEVVSLKKELIDASFELGPSLTEKIKKL